MWVVVRRGLREDVNTYSRPIKTPKGIVGDFQGITARDPYAGWPHTEVNRQMRICHQMRPIKWDFRYKKPDGETTAFPREPLSIHRGIYMASGNGDGGIRLAGADRPDAEPAALMERQWEGRDGNTGRYGRESRFLAVCLRVPGIPSDNNPVERSNRKVVAARSYGGGNRSGKGMEANPIPFTNMITDWLAGRSFFDHMVPATGRRAPQSDGNRKKPQGRGRLRMTCGPSMRMRPPANIASKSKTVTKI